MPEKPTLILYSPELPNCICFDRIFNTVFESHATETAESFLHRLQTVRADAEDDAG